MTEELLPLFYPGKVALYIPFHRAEPGKTLTVYALPAWQSP